MLDVAGNLMPALAILSPGYHVRSQEVPQAPAAVTVDSHQDACHRRYSLTLTGGR